MATGDGGTRWTVVESVLPGTPESTGGWRPRRFALSSLVSPSAETRFRFVASDTGFPTHVEFAIDDFTVWRVESAFDETFVRGDVDLDGSIQLTDVVYFLETIFGGARVAICPDAADANDDGTLDPADAVALLAHIFASAALPPPYTCDVDPTPDALVCFQPTSCR